MRDSVLRVGVMSADDAVTSDWFPSPNEGVIEPLFILPSAAAAVDWSVLDIAILHRPTIVFLEELRRMTVSLPLPLPMLVVSELAESTVRARWLDAGADDCLSEPVCPRELAARVRALLRRGRIRSSDSSVIAVGRIEVHLAQRGAYLDGTLLELSSLEFDLLATLAQFAGQVLSRERLLGLIHGRADDAFDRSIDVQVSRLRAKLGDDPRDPRLLKTVRGRGYLLAES